MSTRQREANNGSGKNNGAFKIDMDTQVMVERSKGWKILGEVDQQIAVGIDLASTASACDTSMDKSHSLDHTTDKPPRTIRPR